MSNQLFEAVPVSEKPEKTGKYVALETNYGIEEWMEMRYDKFSDSWFDGAHCFHPTHWLKPIAPTKEAEQRAKELYPYNNDKNDHVTDLMNEQLQKAYIKGHQEASAMKEELNVIKSRISGVMNMGESICEVTKYADGYNTCLEHVKEWLSPLKIEIVPSDQVKDDWVRVEDMENFVAWLVGYFECDDFEEAPIWAGMWNGKEIALSTEAMFKIYATTFLQSPTPTTDKVEEEIKRPDGGDETREAMWLASKSKRLFHVGSKTTDVITPFTVEELKSAMIEYSPTCLLNIEYSKNKPLWHITNRVMPSHEGVEMYADSWADKTPKLFSWEKLHNTLRLGGLENIRF